MTLLSQWIEVSSTWGEPLRLAVAVVLKSSLILSLALAVTAMLRRASAATRHLVLVVGIGASLVLPLARLALPPFPLAILPAAEPTAPAPTRVAAPPAPVGAEGALEPPPPEAAEPALASQRFEPQRSVAETALLGVAVVSGLLALYLLIGIARVRLLGRRAAEPDPGSSWWSLLEEIRGAVGRRGPVTLKVSDRVRVPLTLGILPPVVLLPSESADWAPEARRAVLLHELGHVRRGDWLVQIAARLVCSLYWFNPLVWIATAKLLVEAERACDDIVLRQGQAGPGYARQLLEMATLRRRELPVFGAVAMARRATLSERIQAILDPGQPRSTPGRRQVVTAAAVAVVAVLVLAPARIVRAAPGVSAAVERSALGDDTDEDWNVDVDWDESLDEAVAEGLDDALDDENLRHEVLRGLADDDAPPLLRAVARGDRAEARRLLGEGANPNQGATELGTPLILAAADGNREMVDLLLRSGASPNLAQLRRRVWPELPRSPLGAGARAGDPGVIDLLLEAGAEVDFAPQGDAPPLSIAARHGHLAIVERLLAAGADPSRVTRGDGTPLIAAARNGDPRIVRTLLDAGAEPDTWVDGDESPLFHAVASGQVDVVDLLLERGADPNAVWEGDGTPLQIAVATGNRSLVDRLLRAGARGDVGVDGDGNALIEAARSGRVDLLRRMLDAGANPNAAVEGDGNALIGAAANGHLEAARLLVERGADVDRVVPGDENPLIQAAGEGHYAVVEFLLDVGADPDVAVTVESWRGGTVVRTALGQAEQNGHDRVARVLRQRGATNRGRYE